VGDVRAQWMRGMRREWMVAIRGVRCQAPAVPLRLDCDDAGDEALGAQWL